MHRLRSCGESASRGYLAPDEIFGMDTGSTTRFRRRRRSHVAFSETGQRQRVASRLRAKPVKGAPNVVGTPAIVGTPVWVVAHVGVLGAATPRAPDKSLMCEFAIGERDRAHFAGSDGCSSCARAPA